MRRITMLFALLLALLLLVGCENDGETIRATPEPDDSATIVVPEATSEATETAAPTEVATTPTPAVTAEPTLEVPDASSEEDTLADVDPAGQSVLFWHTQSAEREAALQELVAQFNEENEQGITVTAAALENPEAIYDRLTGQIAASEEPDLVVAYQDQAAEYRQEELIIDLSPYIQSATWGIEGESRQDFFAAFVNSDYNALYGEQLGFPLERSVEVLYYNADLLKTLGFDAPPSNWEAFREMTCAAKEKGVVGYQLTGEASHFASMLFSRGGDLMNEAQDEYTLDSAQVVETAEYLKGLYEEGCITLAPASFSDPDEFGGGNLLFSIASSAFLPRFTQAVEAGYKGKWAVTALPHETPDPVMNIYGSSLSILSRTPEKQLAAWLFLKWMTEPEQQLRWAEIGNGFPVRKSVVEELDSYLADNPNYEVAFNLLDFGKSEPAVAGYDFTRRLLADGLMEIVRGADVSTTLADINEEANVVLESLKAE
ncbi:MAG: extracellular solute-binding protein [Ardenticatenales bacterium]|nr:extracellular solute-binding protein [Ardenticatenales bacterium]